MVCPAGKVQESVTLVGGITSGYFRDHGKVKDMQKCRRICCEMPHCHLAFMLSSNCFSVACKSAGACKTQPANPSRYSPKISYVRNFDTNELLGKTYFYQVFFFFCNSWTVERAPFRGAFKFTTKAPSHFFWRRDGSVVSPLNDKWTRDCSWNLKKKLCAMIPKRTDVSDNTSITLCKPAAHLKL